MIIGVLALQGDFAKHQAMLESLGVSVKLVKTSTDLEDCAGLIIPGGESTVLFKLIDFIGLREPLLNFASQKPVFGTCAGLILMSNHIEGSSFQPLKLLDVDVQRNAYGRQVDSFETAIPFKNELLPAFFIRAPQICRVGEKTKVLSELDNRPVLVQEGKHLGASFHPELTGNSKVHELFIQLIKNS